MSEDQTFGIPFSNIVSMFCFSNSGCSPKLIEKLREGGITLNFLSPDGRLRRIAAENEHLRKAQIRLFSVDGGGYEKVMRLVRNIVSARIANSCIVLKRSLREYPEIDSDGAISECLECMRASSKSVLKMEDKHRIMETERSAEMAYFEIFDRFIIRQKEDFRIFCCTEQFPSDRISALLSFLNTVCISDYAAALESFGLDSHVGFYHEPKTGQSSLACDLAEEVKCIIERMVITLIDLRQIKPRDFEELPYGEISLTEAGKKKVMSLWHEKRRSVIEHSYLKQKIPMGLLPFVQSSLLAKYISGETDEYTPFMLK